ncbi:DUF418 domain-containing protein [Aggregicoccus sp. 17bor-14]|uniref:DUF418 domain-containing protein n=1 Tax=Myxococcaceae TaxID=31 RepID=UPI00129C2DA9|nr:MULTISPECIES: DUF418 domain-containing protein [Myxococcaceae]MBF5044545.1 DUF418 domain-containing protein [Simulacricoccus sp. 17bor-14]MRI90290.1 DUF418 domain-containing protein [Aggregicoccus sp. 17bor-14]
MRPSSSVSPAARPVDSGERIALLDVLRGFALGGVWLSNAALYFSGVVLLPKARMDAWLRSPLDAAAFHLFNFFVAGKAMTLFAFLFGLGFSVQLLRAEARGASVVPLYTRRLCVLLLFGLTHLFALWYGDILAIYAVTGFALLLFRARPSRQLLPLALALILLPPLLVPLGERFLPVLLHGREAAEAAAKLAAEHSAAIKAPTLEAFAAGGYARVVRANADIYVHDFLKPMLFGYLFTVLGKFLLGLVAGRMRLFQDVPAHRALLRRLLLGWGLVLGVLGNGAAVVSRVLTVRGVLDEHSPVFTLLPSVRELGFLGLAALYASLIALAFQRPGPRRLLSLLAPAGRMALTNYLTQTLVSLWLFYGYGLSLIGRLSPAHCIPLIAGLFCVQVALSHLWLAHFRFGPAEWLWRSLTYGQRQPMRRELTARPPAPA